MNAPQDLDLGLMEEESARSLLDQLLDDSRLYKTTEDFHKLLEFVSRMRNFAPFNAMLLQIQKPGLRFAASAFDWKTRFNATVKPDARPLLILWPFCPVALVYDVVDVEGENLPEDARAFVAKGEMDAARLNTLLTLVGKAGIRSETFDGGDGHAGYITVVKRSTNRKEAGHYLIKLNRNHGPVVGFVTLAHELAHLYLGHLGKDDKLQIPDRHNLPHAQREVEAESVAYLLCQRNHIHSKSQTYLADYVAGRNPLDRLDIYHIMKAAGQIETLLQMTSHTRFKPAAPKALAKASR